MKLPPFAASASPANGAFSSSTRSYRIFRKFSAARCIRKIWLSSRNPQRLSTRLLFEAAANDEFEFLEAENDWIHVTISGDSRGYIRAIAVELPERIAARLQVHAAGPADKFPGFRIVREEASIFPGDWAPLKGKQVKLYTVQPVSQNPRETGPAARLNYCLALFEKTLREEAPANSTAEGVA